MTAPLVFTWDGDAMVPAANHRRLADRQYVVGETYRLAIHEERSANSHRHYFAAIHEAWLNLPDDLVLEFTSSERLRKRALVATGWYTERRLALSSPADARDMVRFLMATADDGTVFAVQGNIIIERKARSQRTGAGGMNKAEFQKSKTDVLDWIAALIRVEPKELEHAA